MNMIQQYGPKLFLIDESIPFLIWNTDIGPGLYRGGGGVVL